MSTISIEELGITKEDLTERVIDKIAGDFLDDDGYSTLIERSINKRVQEAIDSAVKTVGEKVIDPNVAAMVEELTLQKTNDYGEKRGEPVTFIEYLTEMAQKYMVEKVDYQGRTRDELGS